MSEKDYQRIEVITGSARRRRWSTEQKLRIIEDSYEAGASVSEVARRHGVAANLLFRWRKLLADGGAAAVGSDEEVVGASDVRKLEARIRELERQLGRKALEVEMLKEALDSTRAKKPIGSDACRCTEAWWDGCASLPGSLSRPGCGGSEAGDVQHGWHGATELS
jgi:transposase